MSGKLSKAGLHILQHSLGLDQYGQGSWYRNHFVTGEGIDNYRECLELERRGLMARALTAGDAVFYVTEAGIRAVKSESPSPPRMTRGQKRYREWLKRDCGTPFGEWLKGGAS